MTNTLFKPKNLFMILLGNCILALAIVMFILPNNLMSGGTTGLALIAEHYFHIPMSPFLFTFNTLTFLAGLFFLGKTFALTTLISTFFYPVIFSILQKIPVLKTFTDDKLLASIFAGLLIGFSIGLVIRSGASTGGMDIPPLILKKMLGLPVSVMLYVFDFLILLGQVLFADKELVLYGILCVLISSIVIDKLLVIGTTQTQVKIISKKFPEINDAIIQKLDRGSTLIHTQTGYLKEEQDMILTVISNRELNQLNQIVTTIDPNAFMIINRINEVKGKGFTLPKKSQEYKC